jgi:hypothetical protein
MQRVHKPGDVGPWWGVPELQQSTCSNNVVPLHAQQILDKEEFTLEELLDEDDIIQECKSLNGRLITL